MKLFIDGDGSPVKDTAIEVVNQRLPIVIVTSVAHYSLKQYPPNVTVVYVDQGTDSVDYKIVQLIEKGDMLITQDYGLASLVLPKDITVLHHLGYEYTSATIHQLLENRYVNQKIRSSGRKVKGPKPYTEQNRQLFERKLSELLQLKMDD